MSHETRSADDAAGQQDLWPDQLTAARAAAEAGFPQGVGARRAGRRPRRGGGGYLNERTSSELRQSLADPRIRELEEIGLSATWLSVAHLLGFDAFMAMWRLLSADDLLRDDDGQIELHLRPVKAYDRYQRNRYIATLVQCGIRPHVIHQIIRAELGERLSYRHVNRLAAASRMSKP